MTQLWCLLSKGNSSYGGRQVTEYSISICDQAKGGHLGWARGDVWAGWRGDTWAGWRGFTWAGWRGFTNVDPSQVDPSQVDPPQTDPYRWTLWETTLTLPASEKVYGPVALQSYQPLTHWTKSHCPRWCKLVLLTYVLRILGLYFKYEIEIC